MLNKILFFGYYQIFYYIGDKKYKPGCYTFLVIPYSSGSLVLIPGLYPIFSNK